MLAARDALDDHSHERARGWRMGIYNRDQNQCRQTTHHKSQIIEANPSYFDFNSFTLSTFRSLLCRVPASSTEVDRVRGHRATRRRHHLSSCSSGTPETPEPTANSVDGLRIPGADTILSSEAPEACPKPRRSRRHPLHWNLRIAEPRGQLAAGTDDIPRSVATTISTVLYSTLRTRTARVRGFCNPYAYGRFIPDLRPFRSVIRTDAVDSASTCTSSQTTLPTPGSPVLVHNPSVCCVSRHVGRPPARRFCWPSYFQTHFPSRTGSLRGPRSSTFSSIEVKQRELR